MMQEEPNYRVVGASKIKLMQTILYPDQLLKSFIAN
jgi:hypothetical protein